MPNDATTSQKVKLYEITAIVSYSVVVAAVSREDALEAISTWEQAWPKNSDFIGVSDVELLDEREMKSTDPGDEAHEITQAALDAIEKSKK